MKPERLFFICALSLILVLSACGLGNDESGHAPDEISPTLIVDDVQVSVLDSLFRSSIQTHYIMNYPEPDHIFLEVILKIQGLDVSPGGVLVWGTENLALTCENKVVELAFPRRVIADDSVEYKVGEEINFNYIFIYNVWRDVDYQTCQLTFSDGQIVDLSPFFEESYNVVSNVQPEENGTVLSGEDNQAYGENAVISGGAQNSANAIHTTVSGGNLNTATASHAAISGGRENSVSGFYGTISGGYANTASARDTFIGGGSRNTASGARSTVGGGLQNQAVAPDTIIAGGAYNEAVDDYAFVGGGTQNIASGYASVVVGGAGNIASNDHASIVGGLTNHVDGIYGAVGGGYGNLVSGRFATIPGGFENKVEGDYSFAAGQHAMISADHSGTFIFADASDMEFPSMASNEFAVRATGGVRFVGAVDSVGQIIAGVQLPPGSGSWATLSDRSAKTGFAAVNQQEILELLVDMPITTWRYLGQNDSVQHIGPMSDDFHTIFGFGEDKRYISTVDVDGVALVAIQGMYDIIQHQDSLIQDQNNRLGEIETQLQEIERSSTGGQKKSPEYILWLGWGFLICIVGVFIGIKWQTYFSGLSSRNP